MSSSKRPYGFTCSQYGTKVIPATGRDATYVLDEILDNETELPILEHTTDTAGYTEIVFALFDLLGLQFSPRIRDLGDQRLFRLDREKRHPRLGALLKGRINRERIRRHWDELLRVAGSLKRGWVTASLLIGRAIGTVWTGATGLSTMGGPSRGRQGGTCRVRLATLLFLWARQLRQPRRVAKKSEPASAPTPPARSPAASAPRPGRPRATGRIP
jgi:hypothetical protein